MVFCTGVTSLTGLETPTQEINKKSNPGVMPAMAKGKPNMAQARMLNKGISLSERVADLKSDTARLLFTWIIPHTDDFGLIVASPRKIKATVFPMSDCSVEDIGFHLEDMVKVGLLKRITHNSTEYLCVVGHECKQTLKKDRNPQTILEYDMGKHTENNWKKGMDIVSGFQLEDIGNQMESEVKRSEVKLSEVKKSEEKGSVKGKTLSAADASDEDLSFDEQKNIAIRKLKELSN